MTTFCGHYLPVEARRDVLRLYRDRRVHGDSPFGHGPVDPLTAAHLTVDYYAGWLAYAVAFSPASGRWSVEDLTHRFRAAKFYLDRVYGKPFRARL